MVASGKEGALSSFLRVYIWGGYVYSALGGSGPQKGERVVGVYCREFSAMGGVRNIRMALWMRAYI